MEDGLSEALLAGHIALGDSVRLVIEADMIVAKRVENLNAPEIAPALPEATV